ncbi:MAG TPA: hypothetical protein PLV83_02860 [Bacilli bacterium]|nr:hypothetical protein [Bacilli bacterium]
MNKLEFKKEYCKLLKELKQATTIEQEELIKSKIKEFRDKYYEMSLQERFNEIGNRRKR